MQSFEREAGESCLSLADGYLEQCPIVREHNLNIGANQEAVSYTHLTLPTTVIV